jgi:predicted ATPase/DNA-binding SARP family transcriptional activator
MRGIGVGETGIGLIGPAAFLRKTASGFDEHLLSGASPRRALSLLAANKGFPVSLDSIAEAVWGDGNWSSGTLRVLLTRLRKELSTQVPSAQIEHVSGAGGYMLVGPFWTDIEIADQTDIDKGQPSADGLSAIDQVLSMWRGEPYLDLENSAVAVRERQRIAELHFRLRERRARVLVALHRSDEALDDLLKIAGDFPYRDAVVGATMQIQWDLGRHVEALQTYQNHREKLLDELGLDPSPDLVSLERSILQHNPKTTAAINEYAIAQDFRTPQTNLASIIHSFRRKVTTLPAYETPIIGRGKSLEELKALVTSRRHVTIVGPGGVGKTRLAAELCKDELIPTHWLDLGVHGGREILEAIGVALRVSWADHTELLDRILDELSQAPIRLVFDNCEHLLDDAAAIAQLLLTESKPLRLLCTSRAPLGTEIEHPFLVEPLTPKDAQELFLHHWGRMSGLKRAMPDLDAVSKWTDGLPLAIELAANTFGSDLPSIATSIRPGLTRHTSFTGALADSFDRLAETERRLLTSSSVLVGTFESIDAAPLLGLTENDSQVLLRGLARQSLLSVRDSDGSVCYRMLEPLREFSLERLRKAGEETNVLGRHEQFLRSEAARLSRQLEGRQERKAVERLERIDAQLRSQWERSVEKVDSKQTFETGVAIAASLQNHSFLRLKDGHFAWGRRIEELSVGHTGVDVAELAGGLAMASWAHSDNEKADIYAKRSLAISSGSSQQASPFALIALLNLAGTAGNGIEALQRFEEVSNWARDSGDAYWQANAKVTEVIALTQMEQFAAAKESAMAAGKIAERSANPSMSAWAHYGLAYACLGAGEDQTAEEQFQEALGHANEVDNRWVAGMCLSGLVTAQRRQGQFQDAAALLAELIVHWYRGQMLGQLAASLSEVALVSQALSNVSATQLSLHVLDSISLRHPLLQTERRALHKLNKATIIPQGLSALSSESIESLHFTLLTMAG